GGGGPLASAPGGVPPAPPPRAGGWGAGAGAPGRGGGGGRTPAPPPKGEGARARAPPPRLAPAALAPRDPDPPWRPEHARAAGRAGALHRPSDDRSRRYDDGGVPRPDVPGGDVGRDRRRQCHPAVHGRRAPRQASGGRRRDGTRVPRGPDDLVRHPRPPPLA